jgi:GntR family transcriptional repressor for pyruvate dehydrogenase complex
MNMVATILFEYRSKTVKRARDLKDSAEQHRNIYRAMRERNAQGAREAMHDHLIKTQAAQRLEVEENFPDGNSFETKNGANKRK